MIQILILIILYIVGFICMVIFLVKYGKSIGLDYSEPRTYVDQEDWDSNKSAYTFFGLCWPGITMLLVIRFLGRTLHKLTYYIIRKL